MFQAIRASTVQKNLKIRILSKKFFQNESFLSFSLKCFDLSCTSRLFHSDRPIHLLALRFNQSQDPAKSGPVLGDWSSGVSVCVS